MDNNNVNSICTTIGVVLVVLLILLGSVAGCTRVENTNQVKAQLEIEKVKLEQQQAENDRLKIEKFGVK